MFDSEFCYIKKEETGCEEKTEVNQRSSQTTAHNSKSSSPMNFNSGVKKFNIENNLSEENIKIEENEKNKCDFSNNSQINSNFQNESELEYITPTINNNVYKNEEEYHYFDNDDILCSFNEDNENNKIFNFEDYFTV